MNDKEIIDLLLDSDISEVEEIELENKDLSLLRIYYEFDDDEIEAAEEFASEEHEDATEEEKKELFREFLYDLALDVVSEAIEDIVDDLGIDCQFSSYELDEEEFEYAEFAAIFYPKGKEVDLDKILDELDG